MSIFSIFKSMMVEGENISSKEKQRELEQQLRDEQKSDCVRLMVKAIKEQRPLAYGLYQPNDLFRLAYHQYLIELEARVQALERAAQK